ncbi:hypothetical protein J4414_04395 [Candidatus Woesearchaeota archaeon]|nr:hypothetical protein [Candidatus Woesearchaeota archaeon]
MSIENLNKAIKGYENKKKVRIRLEKEEELKEQEKETKYKENEKKLGGEKLATYKKILAWKEDFIKTKQFKKLFNKDEDDIIIYWGGWGHKQPSYGGHGCWSRIYLEKSGRLRYWAGYKWMPTGPDFCLDQKTFQKLSYDYLNKLQQDISKGEIYKTIAKELKEREE